MHRPSRWGDAAGHFYSFFAPRRWDGWRISTAGGASAPARSGSRPTRLGGRTMTTSTSSTRNRGFASMDAERQREIARKGGRAAPEKGTAHQFTSDEAREAGRKGGQRVSADRSHMANIGRMGGKTSASRRQRGGDEHQGQSESAHDKGQSAEFENPPGME